MARGDPVDVATGRVFTLPALDLSLPGPLPLTLTRSYSSGACDRDPGMGYGWSHSLGWTVEVLRREIRVWKGDGTCVEFPSLAVGGAALGREGWLLRREAWGFALDAGGEGDELLRVFSAEERGGRCYRLTAVVDRNDNRIDLTYDDRRLVEIIDSARRTIRVRSTPEGRIAAFEVKNAEHRGRWVAFARFAYSDEGDLISATDADGHTTSYAYEAHRLISQRLPTGLTFFYRYDVHGRCVETWGEHPGQKDPSVWEGARPPPSGASRRVDSVLHCVFDYGDDGYTEVTDSTATQRYFANRSGTLDKAVVGGHVHSRTYDEHGYVQSYTDPRGATTAWGRDARGRIVRITDPLGRVTAIGRDDNGRVREIIDRAGGVTGFERDERGNVLYIKNPAGGLSAFEHDRRGLVTAEVAPNGARTTHVHDARGNRVETVLPNGGMYRWTYDALGRMTSETDPLGAVTRFGYTEGGRLLAVYHRDGSVTRYAYNEIGDLTRVNLPGGRRL